jgi:hypothetical protein
MGKPAISLAGKFFLKQNRLKIKCFVCVTDNYWFEFLSQKPEIDEVNFWQPRQREKTS